jgi:hypothetical protein
MSYNIAIPLITDPILQSYTQLRANFQAINTTFAANHIGLRQDATISGMHRVLTMNPQVGDPTVAAGQIAIYNKLDANNVPSLFFKAPDPASPVQLTYESLNTSPVDEIYPLQQYTFAAGPFIIYGGYIERPITQGQAVTLSPGTSLIYVGALMANINSLIPTSIAPKITTGTTFTINFQTPPGNPPATFDLYYFAIGLP